MAAKKKTAKKKATTKKKAAAKRTKKERPMLSAKIDGENVVITLPLLDKAKASASKKTVSIARDQRIAFKHGGKEVTVGAYAFHDA